MAQRVITIATNRSGYSIDQVIDRTLTVEELIEELRYLPGDCKVVFKNDDGYTYGHITDRDIDSEYLEEEDEEEEAADYEMTREDCIEDIQKKVDANDGQPVKCGTVWLDGDREVLTVGYKDGELVGFLDDGSSIPLTELSDDDLDDVWFESTQIRR